MSRGGCWLTAGVLLVIGSFCGGGMIRSAVISSVKSGGGVEHITRNIHSLSGLAVLINLASFAGIIAGIVGIVLLVVDSGRQDQPPSPSSGQNNAPAGPSAQGLSAAEEENRRLREEVERLRREREIGYASTTTEEAEPATCFLCGKSLAAAEFKARVCRDCQAS